MNVSPADDPPPARQEGEPPAPPQWQGPPIPLPSPYSCPHCDLAMQVQADYCPRCGKRLVMHRAASCLALLGAVVLALIAIPMGLIGACSMVFAGFEHNSTLGRSISAGLGPVVVAAVCLWGAAKLLAIRRR